MKLIYIFLSLFIFTTPAIAEVDSYRVEGLESRVSSLERTVKGVGKEGAALFLFGAFCALWAQNTGRSPWLWFFLGLFFSVITVLVLLAKNSGDMDKRNSSGKKPFDLENYRAQ